MVRRPFSKKSKPQTTAETEAASLATESARVRAAVQKYRKARDAALDELELARAQVLADEPVKLSKGVKDSLYREVSEATKAAYRRKSYKPKKSSPYRTKLHKARKEIVEDALRASGGNVSRAARHLEIDPDTVYEAISAA